VKIHTQEIQELNLKSTVNFLKLMEKVICAAADMVTSMRDANATEQLDRIAYLCGLREGHWR